MVQMQLSRLRSGIIAFKRPIGVRSRNSGKGRLILDMLLRAPLIFRLANGLSGLYAMDSEEKRLLDAMLLTMPR